jgi:putative ribonuclease D
MRVTRINLKTDAKDRNELINFCLKGRVQYVAIGWSYIYKEESIRTYQDYYDAVKKRVKRINPALNAFWYTKEDDLFWTRDLDGMYWICRAKGEAIPKCDKELDIGAVVPVEGYLVGLEVPGQISGSFNRVNGGIKQSLDKEKEIVEYSKYMFNSRAGRNVYEVKKMEGGLLNNLSSFDLEELVISYLQIAKGYYVLSNSIAKRSTTINVECEFRSRRKEYLQKAVVQVKSSRYSGVLDALSFKQYINDGYIVYLYAPKVENADKMKNCIQITDEELMTFYKNNKSILPDSITKWENLIKE